MKKSTIKIRFASLICLVIFLGFCSVYTFVFIRCFFSIKYVPEFHDAPLMRVMIYGNSKETVSARLSMMDSGGKEFAIIEKSWKGQNLTIEFSSAAFGGKELLFPIRIYSESYNRSGNVSVYKGTRLTRYYLDDGECAFISDYRPVKEKRALHSLAVFADSQSTKFQSRYSKIYSLNLSALEYGVTYEITTSSDGKINIGRM